MPGIQWTEVISGLLGGLVLSHLRDRIRWTVLLKRARRWVRVEWAKGKRVLLVDRPYDDHPVKRINIKK